MESKNAYTPPLCVWKVIEDAASPEKHSVIRSLLGISKLEYAADLRKELESLIEIWYELNSEKQLATRYSPQTHLGLPEPPKQREMLVAEIHLLLENLRDKENGGTDFIPSDCNEDVINYTNHIVDQRTVTPTNPVLRATPNSVLDDGQIERVAKNIPVLDNETPIDVLREVLQTECDTLLDDIEYVRRCVEEGHCDFQEIPEPSLMELKRERKKLENRLIQSIEMSPVINPGSFSQQNRKNQQPSKIRPRTPVPKRKNLLPVRPTSAIQYSASTTEVTIPHSKPVSNSTAQPSVSLLGSRSNTDPTGKGIKTYEKELRRRNSASDIPHKDSCSEMLPHSSSVLSKEMLASRQYSRIFCGTPDSGVSSRPVSELGMNDTAHEQADVTNNSVYKLGIERKQCSITMECEYASKISVENGCSNSVLSCNTKSPQPPVCPRPPAQPRRSMHRTKFHKIKVPGTGDL